METVKAYIAGLKGIDTSKRKYMLGNLAVANIKADDIVTAKTSNIIKKMAEKIRQRGLMTRAVEELKVGSYDGSLLKGVDPANGDKIPTVLLTGGRKVLYNPETRVAYPLPDFDNKKTQLDEV
jgi:hypothetical protein